MKIKKITAVILIFLTLFGMNVSFSNAASNEEDKIEINYNKMTKCMEYSPVVKAATSGTRYRVIGFKARIHSYYATFKMQQFADSPNGDGTVTSNFRIPFINSTNYDSKGKIKSGSGNTIIQRFFDENGVKSEIVNFFANDNRLHMNAIMTITENGRPLAELHEDGRVTKYNSSAPAVLNKDYFETNAIKYARGWARRDDLDSFFGLYCDFEGVVREPATAVISRDSKVITGSTTFMDNQTINLSGEKSVFPSYADTKCYKWEYYDNGWKTVANGPGKVVGTFPKLKAGSYDVRLTVWYFVGSDEYTEMSDTTQIKMNIEESPQGAYVTVMPSTKGDIKVTQAQIDAKAKIPVAVDAEAFLNNYTDASKITKWIINFRLDPAGAADQFEAITFTTGLGFSQTAQKSFYIPAGVYTQLIAVSASATVNGKVIYSKKEFCAVNLYKDAPPLPKPTNPVPDNKPPVAVISASSTVKVGDNTYISGVGSYDSDGTIDKYQWNIEGASENLSSSYGFVSYPSAGEYKITLVVVDNGGAAGYAQQTIKVVPPTPSASFSVTGKLKDKRIVYLNNTSTSPAKFPLSGSKTTWSITPVTGSGAAADAIMKVVKISTVKEDVLVDPYTSSALTGLSVPAVMFDLAGQYDVTLTVTNTAGLSDSSTQRITIEPDLYPIVKFSSNPLFYRETVINGVNYGKITVDDESYSPDGDFISYRKIYAIYDANNNGVFGDAADQTIVIDESSDRNHIDNVKHFEYLTKEVGKYEVHIKIKESYIP